MNKCKLFRKKSNRFKKIFLISIRVESHLTPSLDKVASESCCHFGAKAILRKRG